MTQEEDQSEGTERLFRTTADVYGDKYGDHCIEQYKTYIESAERVSDRRQTANAFFLSANSLLVAAESILVEHWSSIGFLQIFISFAGGILCFTWYRLIRSYRDMNSGKFKVINAMEKELPMVMYDAEWDVLGRGDDPSKYLKFTKIELRVPKLFLALHILVGLIAVLIFVYARCIAAS